MLALILCVATCLFMILALLFFPKIRFFGRSLSSYWVVALTGALLLLLFGCIGVESVLSAFLSDSAVNPLKILVLFISMTLLSVFLDEMGLFRYLAYRTLRRAGSDQGKLFLLLYAVVSILTVFTSNDVIVLSFTPFICYFAAAARIDPLPYLAAEFVAANTWSMMLEIGNPTNIYLAESFGVSFLSYVGVMAIPTLVAGAVSLLCLWLLFRRRLSAPLVCEPSPVTLPDKPSLFIGLFFLLGCTLLLAFGSYVGVEMWLVALLSLLGLCLSILLLSILRHRRPASLGILLRRAPWELVPFLLSMFVMVLSLSESGTTDKLASLLTFENKTLHFGILSFLAANLMNNIPMSVFFSSLLGGVAKEGLQGALYATVIGSNLGAFFTPIGALAGIMFGSILAKNGLRFGYRGFLKIGFAVAVPTLFASLFALQLCL